MYFPWVGMLQQIRLADVFVFYDDVQFARGGFLNRVQVKTPSGVKWMTLPLRDQHLGQQINEVAINESSDWRRSHFDLLANSYRGTPFRGQMLALVERVLQQEFASLADVSRASMLALIDYFQIGGDVRIESSSKLPIAGRSSQRVVDLCVHLGASTYVTGHGARNYLDHEGFEAKNISVAYMNYHLPQYPQAHGGFTPYVSALDIVANCGPGGRDIIAGEMQGWRDFLTTPRPSHDSGEQ